MSVDWSRVTVSKDADPIKELLDRTWSRMAKDVGHGLPSRAVLRDALEEAARLPLDADQDELTRVALSHQFDHRVQEVVGGYRNPGHWWEIWTLDGRKLEGKTFPSSYDAERERDRLNMRAAIGDVLARLRGPR